MKQEVLKTARIAVPIILGNMSQMALGILDSAMVGAIDYVQLAASSLVINLLAIPYVAGMGITMSISPLVAINNARGDRRAVSHYLFNGFILCTLAAFIIAIGVELSRDIVFHIGQDPEVARISGPYLSVMAWSTVPMVMFLALKQFADGLEHTRVAMLLSLAALPINAFLNWLLIFGNWGFPRMELLGAGIATLITRVLIFVALAIVILRSPLFKRFVGLRRTAWQLNGKSQVELLKIGIPSSLQHGMESGAFAVSGIIIGWLGATQQAAHQIALNCAAFTFMVSMGLSAAGSIRVSSAFGRGDWPHLRKIGVSTLITSLAYGIFCAVFFVVLRNILPLAFNDNAEVLAMSGTLLLYAAFFQISDASQAVGVGLLRGMTDVRIPTILVAIAYWILGIPVGYYFAFTQGIGAPGMWIGFLTGLSFSAILLNWRFLRLSSPK
jgi:MATE family multidrug resistance protein